MFTQCPECKTIFGFNEETTKIARGKVRCSQCSHVFVATEHLLEELPKVVGESSTSVSTSAREAPPEPKISVKPVPAPPETRSEIPEPEPTAEESDDDSFSLLDAENEFMESISDNYVQAAPAPLPEIDESLIRNAETLDEVEPASETFAEETPAEPAEQDDDLASEWASMLSEEEAKLSNEDSSTIEAAMAGKQTVSEEQQTTPADTSADDLAAEWASMLGEEEQTAPADIAEEITAESTDTSADDLATEWASMLGEEESGNADTQAAEPSSVDETATAIPEETAMADIEADMQVELGANSSLQDFVESHLDELTDEEQAEEALALDISLHENGPISALQSTAETEETEEHVPAAIINDLQAAEEIEQSWGKTLLWAMGVLTLLVLLTVQFIHGTRNELAQIASVRPAIVTFCNLTGCKIPLYSNLAELEFVSQDVRTHPRYNNALYINVVFINKSRFYQAYPVIEFKLSDINQQPVAGRYFLPEAYMDKATNILEGIKPNVPVHAVIEINDPGAQAVNYDFEFR